LRVVEERQVMRHAVILPALPDIEAKPTRGYWTRGINP
jgi:hypothetical protein